MEIVLISPILNVDIPIINDKGVYLFSWLV